MILPRIGEASDGCFEDAPGNRICRVVSSAAKTHHHGLTAEDDYSGAFPKYLSYLHDGVASDRDNWKFEIPHLVCEGISQPGGRSSR